MSAYNLILWVRSVSALFMCSAISLCSGRPIILSWCSISFPAKLWILWWYTRLYCRTSRLSPSPLLILYHSFSLLEILKYFLFMLQEVYSNSPREIIYECNIVPSTPMNVTGEGPYTYVYMRSSKPFVCDIEKATLCQNLQRPSL